MRDALVKILADQPLLLLFLVVGVGFPLGRLRLFGAKLGVGAVLFTGLAFGALSPDIGVPEILVQFGLVLFIYTLGLASAPAFFGSLRSSLRPNLGVLAVLISVGVGVAVVAKQLGVERDAAVGLFAGALTNTPAMAAALDLGASGSTTVAYAIAYPLGVLVPILVLALTGIKREATSAAEERVVSHLLRVENSEAIGSTIAEFQKRHALRIVFGRVVHQGEARVATAGTVLQEGDLCTVVGLPTAVETASGLIGPTVQSHGDAGGLNPRRLLVSNRSVAGRTLRDLAFPTRFNSIVTRISRGDVELPASADSVLLLGDRLLVLGTQSDSDRLASEVGDSVRQLHELDVLALGIGVAFGLALGMVTVPLPTGSFRLGLAGGPLVAALVLGQIHRTKSIVWDLSFGANRTIRQLGLVLFLAGVGTRSGHAFWQTLWTHEGPRLLLFGAVVSLASAFTLAWGLRWFDGHSPGCADGIVAGAHTQPAVLGFALERHRNEEPNIGYSMVFPLATIAKIVLAQLLVLFW